MLCAALMYGKIWEDSDDLITSSPPNSVPKDKGPWLSYLTKGKKHFLINPAEVALCSLTD